MIGCFGEGLAQCPDAIEARLAVAANRVLLGVAEYFRGEIVERPFGAAILDIDADHPEIRGGGDDDIAAMGDGDIETGRKVGMRFETWPARGAGRENETLRIEGQRFTKERPQQPPAGNTLIASRSAPGLVLVLSIGFDYAIFCREATEAQKDVTMLGILLAFVTTLLSFGLLAFSGIFALRSFGLVLFIGTIVAFALSPLARKPQGR